MGITRSRWWIAVMGALLQLCLGSVYAWSYFQQLLVDSYGWRHARVAWTFSLAIAFLGAAAATGGVLLPRLGPRNLALAGALLYALGYLISALALHWKLLWLLWLAFGVVGGIGLGLGYVTPVATAAKWFPDKKGLVTGMVVMGFGFGALLMSKVIAPGFMLLANGELPLVLLGAAGVFGIVGCFAAFFMRNPVAQASDVGSVMNPDNGPESLSFTQVMRENVCSWQFAVMWLMFFCNITAGIAIIGFQSPLFQGLCRLSNPALSAAALATAGATLIAVSSIFNGIGRLLWGAVSDRIGQVNTFRLLLATQIGAFACLMLARDPRLFGALVCYVLLCYGGGFGVMPAFVLNTFGAGRMALVYGCILTAWSAAGIVGPQVVAYLKDNHDKQAAIYSFGFGAGLLVIGFSLSFFLQSPAALARKDKITAR